MKNNVSLLLRSLSVVLVLALFASGCSRRPKYNTVLPGRTSEVPQDGLAGNSRNPGGRNGIDNGTPINNGGFVPPVNTAVTPVTDGGIGTDDSARARTEWDALIPNPDKFAAQTVYFDFDKYVVKPGEVEKIRVVATHLKANAAHRVQIDGHCDERGTEEYNRSLGEKRAQALREFLVREGVSPDRVRTVSFGEDRPVDPGHSEASWSKNRRGEFILMTPPHTL